MKRIDPVCGMEVDEERACTHEVGGETHYFCSEGCRDRFIEQQERGKQRCEYELIVVGGGPAGLTAAVYASMLKIDTFVITQDLGGQAVDSTKIENYMGYDFITGPELIEKFERQLLDSHYVDHRITEAESIRKTDGRFEVTVSDLRRYSAEALIVATGMTRRRLGVPGEEKFQRRGVFYGNVQDVSFVEGEDVVVIGGGNSAMQAVETLHPAVRAISVVCRGDVTADPSVAERALGLEGVTIYRHHKVEEILGEAAVSGIRIREQGKADPTELPAKGVFVSIGLAPNSSLVADLVTLTDGREIAVAPDCSTDSPGLFAAGDVTNAFGKRIIIASGEGAKAALAARRYLLQARRRRNAA
jgi:alkyl hydroperoxide reductase subunit F